MSDRQRSQTPIAIVGVSALFPGSLDSRGFWSDILAGRDLVTDVPASHWLVDDYYDPDPTALDKTYSKRGAFLSPIDFDPMEFGVPPTIVPATDSAQILALIVAQRVLDDAAQGQFAKMDRERISVLLGVTSAQELLGSMVSRLQKPIWLKALRESGIPETEAQAICERMAKSYVPWQESSFPGLLGNVVAGRIANRFDLRGTNAVTDAACASSMAAMSMGINELALGQSDLVITGGVDAMNDIFMYMCFSKTPALSPTGDCRPFSDAADGTLLGEGLAMMAMKRLEDAERDGDRVYAVIRGLGSASDGRSKSVYAPVPEGQARALRRAYELAGYDADTVELVEAHGTGTKAGDAAEFGGLELAFNASGREDRQWCALGSVKSQIGHTKAAAGAAGLFKAIMALHHKVLPPTIKVERPNPKLSIEKSPFYLNTVRRPWIRDAAHPRRASVSSFGFGGSNFHVALEEYVPAGNAKAAPRLRAMDSELIVLSAASGAELVTRCRSLAKAPLWDVARKAQTSFDAKAKARLAIVATDDKDLDAKLAQAASMIEKSPTAAFSTPTGIHYAAGDANPGEVAFLFPGQGSQYVGMGADVAMSFDAARAAWDAAAGRSFDGERLHDVVFPHPVFTDEARAAQTKKLVATEWAQPALGVSSLALASVLARIGITPSCVAGHSFGEVTALAVAGALDADALVSVARRRGELMRDAAASVAGAMTAVPLPIDEVRAMLSSLGDGVVIANHNGPTQVVLSGTTDAIAQAEKAFSAKGVEAKRLPVATAFHSPLVAGSSTPLLSFLVDVNVTTPRIPVYGNADAAPYPSEPDAIKQHLAAQLAQPVRFVDQIEAMYARGVRTFVEVGSGNVLGELATRILTGREHVSVSLDRKGKNGVASLNEGLGRLAVAGVAIDFAALWTEYAPPSDKPVKKPAMVMAINGTNTGKPYPPPGGSKDLPKPNPARAVVAAAASVSASASVAASAPASAPVAASAAVTTVVASAPAYVVAAPWVAPDAHSAWVNAYQEAQRQTADAHAAYQRAMADSHVAFLRTAEASFSGLAAMVTGQPLAIAPQPALALAAHVPAPLQYVASEPVPVPVQVQVQVPVPAPIPAPAPVPVATPAVPSVDLEALMLAIVAEKTGYPAEMLGGHMELEADLGIDSIKRVEILSAMRERAPNLREVKPTELAALRTLGQIVDHMRAHAGATAAPAAVAVAAAPAGPSVDLEALMLAIVAEKTGYPAEMLGGHMELEADLGIDSIKRVEILSAMRERAPGLREVKPTELAALRTLGQIVDHMRAHSGAATAPAAAAAPVAAAPSVDLEALMLAIVAEKTGYPAEMLGGHMELEADLGIDSIKRVEILSAMRERAPGLREVKPTELAALRTLGQIVDHMRAHTGAPTTAAPAPVKAAPKAEIGRFSVREVAAPAIGMALSGVLSAAKLVVTDDGGGLAAAVVAELAKRGAKAVVVSEVPADATAVVFLGGMRAVASDDEAIAVNREAFRAARAVAARFTASGGTFVTVQDTGGDFGLSGSDARRAWLGGVSALARTAAREWPSASVKAIDCARGGRDVASVAAAIAIELVNGGPTLEVGLHADGTRTTLESVATAAPGGEAGRVGPDSVIVASGGARGVTAAALVALAKAKRPRIVLLGRTALETEAPELASAKDEGALKKAIVARVQAAGGKPAPAEISAEVSRVLAGREVRATLTAIEATGANAKYVAVDVQDPARLASALDGVRKAWGPITGVVHGAGVLADKRLEEKTDAQFDRVFDTKIAGLRALLAATANDPIDTLCLFSSVAARAGNVGQSDYAMANEVLNAVACAERARRGGACVVRSIGWGPWEGGMVTPALKAHFEQSGVALIPLDVGADRFVSELSFLGDDVSIVIGGASGEGALSAVTTPAASVEVHVDARSHGYLADHAIAGIPVVPVALATEWMLRAARACRPDLVPTVVRSVKVLRGIKLGHFEGAGDLLTVRARQISNGTGAELALEVRGAGDALCYSATVSMSERAAAVPALEADPERGAAPSLDVYDGHVLFHGAQFHVIRGVESLSKAGLAGSLVGAREKSWPSESWQSDPAIFDGGLQLVLLWARHALGGAYLPMGIGEVRLHRAGLVDGVVRCVVRSKKVVDGRAVCDVSFVDASGAVVASLVGVETVLRPGEPTTTSAPALA